MKSKIVQITALDSTMKGLIGLLNIRSLDAGYEVHCICSPGQDTKELLDRGYIVHPVKIDRKISPLKNLKNIIKISKIIKKINPDIVHVHTPVASVIGRIASKIAGVKNIIYTAHGFYFHEGMNKKQYKLFFNIEKWIGRFCTDYIFTQSKEDFQLAKDNKFLKSSKSKNYLHISNGIDIDNRFNIDNFKESLKKDIREHLKIENDSLIITFIGRMVKEKGILDLLEAIDIVSSDYKVDLIAMGSVVESERDQTLNSYIEKNDKKNVHFIGRVSNVEDYLYTSNVFILPSYREGMPRSIIEAMAMKNAIIATDIRGSREEVIDGFNGFLVDASSPKQIAESITTLIENNELLKTMQSNSLLEVKQKYNEEVVVQKQIEIFDKITKGDVHD